MPSFSPSSPSFPATSRGVPASLLDPSKYAWPEAVRERIVRLEVDEGELDDRLYFRVIIVLRRGTKLPKTTSEAFNRVALELVDAFDAAGLDGTVGLSYLTEAELAQSRRPYHSQ